MQRGRVTSMRAVVKMEEQELAIKARGVVKGYGAQLVLKGLDMDVPYGSM